MDKIIISKESIIVGDVMPGQLFHHLPGLGLDVLQTDMVGMNGLFVI